MKNYIVFTDGPFFKAGDKFTEHIIDGVTYFKKEENVLPPGMNILVNVRILSLINDANFEYGEIYYPVMEDSVYYYCNIFNKETGEIQLKTIKIDDCKHI